MESEQNQSQMSSCVQRALPLAGRSAQFPMPEYFVLSAESNGNPWRFSRGLLNSLAQTQSRPMTALVNLKDQTRRWRSFVTQTNRDYYMCSSSLNWLLFLIHSWNSLCVSSECAGQGQMTRGALLQESKKHRQPTFLLDEILGIEHVESVHCMAGGSEPNSKERAWGSLLLFCKPQLEL